MTQYLVKLSTDGGNPNETIDELVDVENHDDASGAATQQAYERTGVGHYARGTYPAPVPTKQPAPAGDEAPKTEDTPKPATKRRVKEPATEAK